MQPKEFFDRLEKAELRARIAEERLGAYRLDAIHMQLVVNVRDAEIGRLKALLTKQAMKRAAACT